MTTLDHPRAGGHRQSEALTVMQRIFAEGFAAGDSAVVDELCSPDLVEHQFGLSGVGPAAIQHVKNAIRYLHRAVPDFFLKIDDSVQ